MEQALKLISKAKEQLASKTGDRSSAGRDLLAAIDILMRKLEEKTPAPAPKVKAAAPAPKAPAPKAKAKARKY